MQSTNHAAAVIDRKARYSLRIEILAYPTCIRGRRVPVGILPCRLVRKTKMVGLPDGEKMFIRFDTTHERDRQTDTA